MSQPNFPNSPQPGDTYTYSGSVWTWTGAYWRVLQGVAASGGSIVPAANVTYDLGSNSLRWRDLYLSGNTIDLGGTAIKSSATGVSFTSAANAQATVALTVSSIQLSTGGNTVTLVAGTSGLQTVGNTGNAVPIAGGISSVYDIESTSTGYFDLPSGNTAQRPSSPPLGALRYNTTIGFAEVYTSAGWGTFGALPPSISSVTPSTYNGEAGTAFTINGANFTVDATVKFIDVNNVEYLSTQVSFVNTTQLIATTPQDFTVAQEPLDVKVLQASGQVTRVDCIDCGGIPTWTTASGTIATYVFPTDVNYNVSVTATDPDVGASIVYSVSSGSLPSGASLNSSNGLITGTIANPASSTTTNTFTVTATDNAGNQSSRSFNIIRQWADGSTLARAGTSATAIKSLTSTTTDGVYWLKPTNGSGTAFQAWCIMNRDGGGWVKVLQFHNATSMATTSSVNPTGTWINAERNLAAGKIDTADWTALNTTNSFIMAAYNSGKHRYWRYVEGSATNAHHPRTSRIMLVDDTGTANTIITYTSDNCVDSGSYQPGTVSYDFGAGNEKRIMYAQIYHVTTVSRGANYSVQFSDDNSNWTTAFTGVMSASTCGITNGTYSYDPLFNGQIGCGKLAYSSTLTAYGTDLDPTSNYTLSLDLNNTGTYSYSATYSNDTRARCNGTTNYWISDHNYNGSFSGSAPPVNSIPICWTFGTDRVVNNLHWMSGIVSSSVGGATWGHDSLTSWAFFVK